jgi:tRNA A-37 threonylcarbamoyl transferase component Bud32
VAKLGRYQVKSEIGRGAMGVVYLAQDPRLKRQVAIKTCVPPSGMEEEVSYEFQERFLREAQAAASLSHPCIVTIYDADTDQKLGVPYIAMEYVPGRTLKDLLEAGRPLNPAWVFRTVELLAGAIHTAHVAGIIHRDLKPANVLVRTSDAAVKIADFGVARLSTSELTQSGASLGSPAYMSPEQIRGGALDARSDLFSLAVILYECLCGERPFHGNDLAALAYSIAHETPVPVTERIKGLPPGVDDFFQRALAKDPDERFPDGMSFKQALEEAHRGWVGEEGEAIGPIPGPVDTVVSGGAPGPTGLTGSFARRWRSGRTLALRFALFAGVSVALLAGMFFYLGRAAYLQLDAKSGVAAGRLTVLVDGREVYGRDLAAPDPGAKVFARMLGRNQESFEAWIKVPPGKHEVTARVTPGDSGAEAQSSVVVDLGRGEVRRLKLVAGRSLGAPLSLKAE